MQVLFEENVYPLAHEQYVLFKYATL